MNEFQLSQEEQDLEILKNAVPAWKNAKIEPFINDTQVVAPTWDKVKLDQDFGVETESNGNLNLVPVIAGREDGSTFTPGIVNAIGPFTEL